MVLSGLMRKEPSVFKNFTVVGNLTRDFEIHVFDSGKSIAKSSVAVNERRFNKDTNQWEDGDTAFVELVVFESMLENVCSSLAKGDRILAIGTLRIREYDRKDAEGQPNGKGKAVEVLVDEIGPALKWAQASGTKAKRSTTGNGGRHEAPFEEGDYQL